ncbi:MAG: hypothetical protein AAFW84_36195 [Cyanobacteria bacterium J06635_15]
MEYVLDAIASFLVGELGQALIAWSKQFRDIKEEKTKECKQNPSQRNCPLDPVLPSRDYLEAMIGDLIEWQQELKKRKVSNKIVLLLTLLALINLAFDILSITFQNLIEPEQAHAKSLVSESSPESSEDDIPDVDVDPC